MINIDKSLETAKTYSKISKAYAEIFKEPSEHIDDFIKNIPESAYVLDLGCGPGYDTKYMASKGFKTVGTDLSPEMISIAKIVSPTSEFFVDDARKISFADKAFDGVFVGWLLQHIPKKEIDLIIKEISRVLKPNGIAYFGIQEGESTETDIDEPLMPSEKIFMNIMSKSEFVKILQNNRFLILEEFFRKNDEQQELDYNKYVVIAQKK